MTGDVSERASVENPGVSLTLATLNLYHWAEPGVGWYQPDSAGHSAEGWAAKRRWLQAQLREIDADIIAFQEVVSLEALRADCAAVGYAYCEAVAEPRIRKAEPETLPKDGPVIDGGRFYTKPVQAMASRYPMQVSPLVANADVSRSLGVSDDRAFRRPAVRAVVDIPNVGPVVAYACHLKSPGVGVEDALIAGQSEPPLDPSGAARWRLEALSRAHAAAAIQRQFEASQLYHAAAADIAEDPRRPVAIMGDLNDEPDSPSLLALTPLRAGERDGGAHGAEDGDDQSGDDAAYAEALGRFRMADAFRIAPRDLAGDLRPATHRSGAEGSAIDFVLVSSHLQPGAPGAISRSAAWRVHDRHFRGGAPERSSDHAAVSVRFQIAAA